MPSRYFKKTGTKNLGRKFPTRLVLPPFPSNAELDNLEIKLAWNSVRKVQEDDDRTRFLDWDLEILG